MSTDPGPSAPRPDPSMAPKPADADDTHGDLHDVFSALYAGAEWASDAESDDGDDGAAPEPAPEVVSARFSRAQLLRALDDLILPSPSRKRRIFPDPARLPTTTPSTAPLPPLPPASLCAPFSPLPLLARLRTFRQETYSALLPPSLGAQAAALAGWTNAGPDGLACACGARWGVGGLGAIKDARVRVEVVRRLAAGLSARHREGCGWRVAASPGALVGEMRRFAHPLVAASLAPLAQELLRRSLAGPVRPVWSCPVPVEQLDALAAALQAYGADRAEPGAVLPPLDALAAALALFGWYPYDPGFAAAADHVTPGSGTPTDIVACRICQRRVGMWAFQPRDGAAKVFDLQREHVAWCPLRADDWWRECVRLRPLGEVEREGAVDIAALLVSERPAKRWRRARGVRG
ncbi:hypothetical protein Q8F55_002325 [Vanrija albida]|uniref:C3HC-type domain-containing protein n=1 Tax=Vanrija albida TaxID=181172 RepID=A0ABR3Q9H2_9TREE